MSSAPAGLAPSGLGYRAPALHPRLRDPECLADLAERWHQRAWVRVEPLLAPGLAAELAAFIPCVPLTPQLDAGRREQSWRCVVRMPEAIDPQYPACMYRLSAFLVRELPTLAAHITGAPIPAQGSGDIDIHVFRKGSYIDGPDPATNSGIDFVLGLTTAVWPAEWGGHLHIANQRAPLAWDALDLFPGPARMPLISRHVQGVAIMGHLPCGPRPLSRRSREEREDAP